MIHNSWVIAGGNRHDLRAVADTLEPFDAAMADIYAARTGLTDKAVGKLMDAETWINGEDAVAQGSPTPSLTLTSRRRKIRNRAPVRCARPKGDSNERPFPVSVSPDAREIRRVERDADPADVRDAVEPRNDVTEAPRN